MRTRSNSRLLLASLALTAGLACAAAPAARASEAAVPPAERSSISWERFGEHSANHIRTRFYNWGMVGDYPVDPLHVNLATFHSVEVPKGSGMNYSDGITPFVLARYHAQAPGSPPDTTTWSYVMETGYRERQARDGTNRMMRFEPRPGYLQPDPTINVSRFPAMSHDSTTWPRRWPDKVNDPDDPGWSGSWNGYFGKRPAADQESFTVMDDNFYSTLPFICDSTDITRRGLGMNVQVRGFQWSNPQAGNVIFWHYDIFNESTHNYPDIIFGLYMDSGVGGSTVGCDGVAESDDDIAYFDKSLGLNLVYTWDYFGHGVDLNGTCEKTGYLGYAYLETPGNPYDGIDNDDDGITDERRDSGPGVLITSQDAIRAYVYANYDTTKFFATYGRLEDRPAYKASRWWTGDEDMDWNVVTDDVGADGVAGTHDTGEGDGMPTSGEPNFDKTDLHESDQIGLTGFKLNRISSTQCINCGDGITFANLDGIDWPALLYSYFSDPNEANRYDQRSAVNWNIAFLFASGPFNLPVGERERFSLALAFGPTLPELRSAVHTVQQIYNANYQFAVPPKRPIVSAEVGDHSVRLIWDDAAERSIDPVKFVEDFEGYRIYRSTDPSFLDPQVVRNGQGTEPLGNGAPIAQFDLVDGKEGYSHLAVDGTQYWLGSDTGITHTWTDSTAVNGQQYFYGVCAYDFGFDTGADSTSFYPSENSLSVARSLRGGYILPSNVVMARPEPRVDGFTPASLGATTHARGFGAAAVSTQVVNSNLVPDGHLFAVGFGAPTDSVRAESYWLADSTAHRLLFDTGADLAAQGIGPVGSGVLPIVKVPVVAGIDSARTGWRAGSASNLKYTISYQPGLSPNRKRPGYPYDLSIVFSDSLVDHGYPQSPATPNANEIKPTHYRVFAHTVDGDMQMRFRVRDLNSDGLPDSTNDFAEVWTFVNGDSLHPQATWRFAFDPTTPFPRILPHTGDVFDLKLKIPASTDDIFTFTTGAQHVNAAKAASDWGKKPYVVPNPYVGSASFEPQIYNAAGRGDRRLEFRAIPTGGTVRIYTVHGDLVRTLRQDGSTQGFVAWDLRTKDNLDVAPGLYVFHVDGPGLGTFIGKFAVIK
jgi:hypothetical protein